MTRIETGTLADIVFAVDADQGRAQRLMAEGSSERWAR